MGSNTTHGLPYPTGTDRVMDGDNAIQSLAEAVDWTLWNNDGAALNDTGWIALTLSVPAWIAVAGFPMQYRRVGRIVYLRGAVQYVSGPTTNYVCVMPSDVCPNNATVLGTSIGTNTPRVIAQWQVEANGGVHIPDANSMTAIPAANDKHAVHGSWLIG